MFSSQSIVKMVLPTPKTSFQPSPKFSTVKVTSSAPRKKMTALEKDKEKKLLKQDKERFINDSLAFLRAAKKMTFRV